MKRFRINKLDVSHISMGWDIPPHVNCTVKGTALSIGGVAYEQEIWLPMYASGDTLTANWQDS
jgi:hypothetical protein